MSEHKLRKLPKEEPARPKLVLGSDGRLRTSDDRDIGNVWGQQRDIGHDDAVKEARRKAARKAKRQEWFKKTPVHSTKEKVATKSPATKLPAAQTAISAGPKAVEINIHLPSFKLPSFKKARRRTRIVAKRLRADRRLLIASCAFVALVLMVLVLQVINHRHSALAKTASTSGSSAGGSLQGTPDYPTILPYGKTIKQLGGWGRISPKDRDPVYAYVDTINGVQINVSEQPLPQSFKTDLAGSLAKLAKSFSATQTLDASDQTVYIGNSTQGPQSLILTKSGLLILIKSASSVPNPKWVDYISSLE